MINSICRSNPTSFSSGGSPLDVKCCWVVCTRHKSFFDIIEVTRWDDLFASFPEPFSGELFLIADVNTVRGHWELFTRLIKSLRGFGTDLSLRFQEAEGDVDFAVVFITMVSFPCRLSKTWCRRQQRFVRRAILCRSEIGETATPQPQLPVTGAKLKWALLKRHLEGSLCESQTLINL